MGNQRNKDRIRCIAVDDEPFALEIIADDIRKIPFLDLIGVFSNALDAEQFLKENATDLIFLDIQMPTLSGTQFIRALPDPPMVIFTTAYEQYALEGYDLNITDYLLKPVPFERFLRAANKAFEMFTLKAKNDEQLPTDERHFFFIHAEYKQVKLFYDDLLYIEGLKDYVKIFVRNNPKPILTRLNLKAIESKLPDNQFCRVHQSYIVALDKITSFQKTRLLIDKQEIPVGRTFLEVFKLKYSDS